MRIRAASPGFTTNEADVFLVGAEVAYCLPNGSSLLRVERSKSECLTDFSRDWCSSQSPRHFTAYREHTKLGLGSSDATRRGSAQGGEHHLDLALILDSQLSRHASVRPMLPVGLYRADGVNRGDAIYSGRAAPSGAANDKLTRTLSGHTKGLSDFVQIVSPHPHHLCEGASVLCS